MLAQEVGRLRQRVGQRVRLLGFARRRFRHRVGSVRPAGGRVDDAPDAGTRLSARAGGVDRAPAELTLRTGRERPATRTPVPATRPRRPSYAVAHPCPPSCLHPPRRDPARRRARRGAARPGGGAGARRPGRRADRARLGHGARRPADARRGLLALRQDRPLRRRRPEGPGRARRRGRAAAGAQGVRDRRARAGRPPRRPVEPRRRADPLAVGRQCRHGRGDVRDRPDAQRRPLHHSPGPDVHHQPDRAAARQRRRLRPRPRQPAPQRRAGRAVHARLPAGPRQGRAAHAHPPGAARPRPAGAQPARRRDAGAGQPAPDDGAAGPRRHRLRRRRAVHRPDRAVGRVPAGRAPGGPPGDGPLRPAGGRDRRPAGGRPVLPPRREALLRPVGPRRRRPRADGVGLHLRGRPAAADGGRAPDLQRDHGDAGGGVRAGAVRLAVGVGRHDRRGVAGDARRGRGRPGAVAVARRRLQARGAARAARRGRDRPDAGRRRRPTRTTTA